METRLVLVCARMQPEDVVEPVHAIQQDHFDVPDEQCTAPKVQWGPRGAFPDHTALLLAATQAVTMHAKGNLAYLLLSMLPPFGLTSGLVKLLHLDRENQFCDAFSDAAHGGPNTLQQACSATVAERKPLDYSAIDICCQNRGASAQGPYTLNPFSLHFLCIGVNLLIHVVEGAFMFTVLAFLDSGTLMTLRNTLAEKWQSQIGYCPQQDCLLSNLTVQDHLVLFARLRGLPGGRLRDYVNNMLKTFRLQEKGRECPRDMSLSDKRKLSLAIALTGTPSLVFLDEPLQGVDAVTHQRLYQVIQHLCKKSKTTFLYASTGMRQLELMCKRLAIIVDGHLQCIGTIDHLREKFGQGMTVKIQLSGPEKERVLEVQPVMTALFPDSRLIYYHRGLLSFEMYEKRPWSEVFSSISLLLQGFRCDYVLVSETMLEDIYLAFSKSYYHGTTNRPRSVF
ncbi:phospholipid-transporting ATPase ABCA3-like isoform X3 [Haemaphysalis longicornis]